MELVLNKTIKEFTTLGEDLRLRYFNYGTKSLVRVYTLRKNKKTKLYEAYSPKTKEWSPKYVNISFKYNLSEEIERKLESGEIVHIIYEDVNKTDKRVICLFSESIIHICNSNTCVYTDAWALSIKYMIAFLNTRRVFIRKVSIFDTNLHRNFDEKNLYNSVVEYVKFTKVKLKDLFEKKK